MDARTLMQGGAPAVCLAFPGAFKREAYYLSRIRSAPPAVV